MPYSLRFVVVLFALAFVAASASLVAQYRQTQIQSRLFAEPLAGGNVDRGKAAIRASGCGACHAIPGLPEAVGDVGPSLDKVAIRATVDGRLANTPENLVTFLQRPKDIDPQGAMPNQGLNEKEARDIAAYLYTRR